MSICFTVMFLFAIGCVLGWCIELVFRRMVTGNGKWINPGFLVGPYLPLYGFGLTVLYLLASLEERIVFGNPIIKAAALFLSMGIAMTAIEYIAGIIFIKNMKIKLWDYSDRWGNIQGIICPLYSVFWTLLGVFYYYVIHWHIAAVIDSVSSSFIAYFALGMYYGVFVIDLVYSMKIVTAIRAFAEEQKVIVKLEELKANIIQNAERHKRKAKFFTILTYGNTVTGNLRHNLEEIRKFREEIKNKIKEEYHKR